MGLREQSIVGCFPESVFLFSVEQVFVGLRKQFLSNFVFSTWACGAGFNNNNNNAILSSQIDKSSVGKSWIQMTLLLSDVCVEVPYTLEIRLKFLIGM